MDQDREDAGDTDDVEDAAGDHGPAPAAPGEVSLVADKLNLLSRGPNFLLLSWMRRDPSIKQNFYRYSIGKICFNA